MMLNCMIVDDEPLAIKLLQSFVERTPFLHLSGAYLNPTEALSALNADVHLLFLDIQMPGVTGLELSRLVPSSTRIVFTTAFKEYAFESYEVQALDYLLKPVSYPAFLKAASRAKTFFEQDMQMAREADASCLFVKSEFKLVRVDFDNILFVSGLKDYVRFHLADGRRPLIALMTMKAVEEKLPGNRFCRVHRSYIVALDKIESIERNRIYIGSELIPISEACQETLKERIGGL